MREEAASSEQAGTETVRVEGKPSGKVVSDSKPSKVGSDGKEQPLNPAAAEMLHRQQIQQQQQQEYQRYRYPSDMASCYHSNIT